MKEPTTDVWFKNAPIGKNTIGTIAKKMFEEAGLNSSLKTNHSGRKTAIQSLLHSGIAPNEVQQLSGHKNIQSLNSYSTLSAGQQQTMSNVLSRTINAVDKKNEPFESMGDDTTSSDVYLFLDDNGVPILDEDSQNGHSGAAVESVQPQSILMTQSMPELNCITNSFAKTIGLSNPTSFMSGIGTINGNVKISMHIHGAKKRKLN